MPAASSLTLSDSTSYSLSGFIIYSQPPFVNESVTKLLHSTKFYKEILYKLAHFLYNFSIYNHYMFVHSDTEPVFFVVFSDKKMGIHSKTVYRHYILWVKYL